MLSLALFTAVFGAAGSEWSAALHKQADEFTSDVFLEKIVKGAKGQWKPKKLSHEEMFQILRGGFQKDRPDLPQEVYENARIINNSQPLTDYTNYDSRTAHSGCIGAVRNQASCGSCWAFAAAETFSDNECVQVGDRTKYSPQDLVSCDTTDMGCQGGTLPNVWSWIVSHGITSDNCMPYTAGGGNVASCPLVCPSDSDGIARKKCNKYNMLSSTNDIKNGIFSAGSVEVGMSVYSDFTTYDGGIYKHTTGQYLGGHAVKAVGWGVQYEKNYWLVQNSWGPSWGESGFFRIDMSDEYSDLGIGGGFNCGLIYPLPTMKPTPPPTDCKDISPGSCADIHSKATQCPYMYTICLETCQCCEDPIVQPSWCKQSANTSRIEVE